MKSLIVFVLSFFLAVVSLNAQSYEVKEVKVGGFDSNDITFKSHMSFGDYYFDIVIQVLCEGKVDTVTAYIDHRVLIIDVRVSAEQVLRCPGYFTRVCGNINIGRAIKYPGKELFKEIQYRVVSRVKNMPTQYIEIKMYNQNGEDITPPAFR